MNLWGTIPKNADGEPIKSTCGCFPVMETPVDEPEISAKAEIIFHKVPEVEAEETSLMGMEAAYAKPLSVDEVLNRMHTAAQIKIAESYTEVALDKNWETLGERDAEKTRQILAQAGKDAGVIVDGLLRMEKPKTRKSPSKAKPPKANPPKVDSPKVKPSKAKPPKVDFPKVNPPKAKPPQEKPQVKPSQVRPPEEMPKFTKPVTLPESVKSPKPVTPPKTAKATVMSERVTSPRRVRPRVAASKAMRTAVRIDAQLDERFKLAIY